MPCRPEEASSLPPHYEQKGLLGPDGNWLSKRARLNQGGSVAIASPVRRADGLMVTGDSSEDEDGWRVHERFCIDHRAEFDMHEIIENVFTRAAEFMHDIAACAWMRTMLVSLGISTSGTRLVVPRTGVFGDARYASRPSVPAPSAS
jgi:hypothetical protein